MSLISQSPTARRIGRALFARPAIASAICVVVANIAIFLLIRLLSRHTPVQLHWWLEVVMAVGMLLSSLLVAIHQRVYWHLPSAKLAELLPLVRQGEAAIEELGSIQGGLAPFVCELQETLRDLKRQRAEVARIESEIRQRLANRTDALERSLGVMRQQAARDVLTGLLNRRALDEVLPKIIASARADAASLVLMMTDVDNFKPLNDTLGHAAGDDLLRSLGQLLRSTLRDSDHAFRYGGDEFVLLLPNTSREQAEAISQRLVSLVDTLSSSLPVAKPPRLSIGMLCVENPPNAPEELLREADRLLYEIKAARKGKSKPPVQPARPQPAFSL